VVEVTGEPDVVESADGAAVVGAGAVDGDGVGVDAGTVAGAAVAGAWPAAGALAGADAGTLAGAAGAAGAAGVVWAGGAGVAADAACGATVGGATVGGATVGGATVGGATVGGATVGGATVGGAACAVVRAGVAGTGLVRTPAGAGVAVLGTGVDFGETARADGARVRAAADASRWAPATAAPACAAAAAVLIPRAPVRTMRSVPALRCPELLRSGADDVVPALALRAAAIRTTPADATCPTLVEPPTSRATWAGVAAPQARPLRC